MIKKRRSIFLSLGIIKLAIPAKLFVSVNATESHNAKRQQYLCALRKEKNDRQAEYGAFFLFGRLFSPAHKEQCKAITTRCVSKASKAQFIGNKADGGLFREPACLRND